MPLNPAILEQLASRICHDLISPVGAIGNGLELLEELGDISMGDEAIKLIAYSATQAAAKLAAFRLAYGAGGADPNIKPEDVQKIFGKYISGDGKIRQAWDPFGNLGIDAKTPGFCKMLMLALMTAAEALPRGGMVLADPGTANETLITAQGQDTIIRDGVEDALAGKMAAENIDPRMVHPAMVGIMGERYNFALSVKEKAEGKVVFSLIYKG